MFVLRAKCKLSDASDEIALFGVAGPAATAMLGDAAVWQRRPHAGASAIRLPDAAGLQRALLAAPVAAEVDVGAAPAMTLATWRWLEVRERHRHDRGGDGRPLRAADGQLRARRRRRFPEGLLPRPGGRRAQPVPRHDQAPHLPLRLRRRCRPRDRTSSSPATSTSPPGRSPTRRRIPSSAAAARSSRCASPRSGADLRLGGADGPPLAPRPLPYPVPLDVAAPA